MQHQLDFVALQRLGVGAGPGRVDQIAHERLVAQLAPQGVGDVRGGRVEHAQQDAEGFAQGEGVAFAGRAIAVALEGFDGVEHLHRAGDHGVELQALVVVVHLAKHGVDFVPQRPGGLAQSGGGAWLARLRQLRQGRQAQAAGPQAAQKAVAAFHGGVVPLQRGLGRRGEHGVKARGIGPVLLDERLRIDAVVFGFGHGAHAFVVDGRAGGQLAVGAGHGLDQPGGHLLAAGVQHRLHVSGPEVFLAALGGAAAVDVVEHHALREQAGERLVDADQPQIAHGFGPKARVEQVQDGVLDAADVLVHRHPVRRAAAHHFFFIVRVAVAHEVPR